LISFLYSGRWASRRNRIIPRKLKSFQPIRPFDPCKRITSMSAHASFVPYYRITARRSFVHQTSWQFKNFRGRLTVSEAAIRLSPPKTLSHNPHFILFVVFSFVDGGGFVRSGRQGFKPVRQRSTLLTSRSSFFSAKRYKERRSIIILQLLSFPPYRGFLLPSFPP